MPISLTSPTAVLPRDPTTSSDTVPGNSPAGPTRVPRIAVWAWSFVGVVAATIIVVVALAAVSEIVLPLTLAAVLAVIFKPAIVVVATVRGVTSRRIRSVP
jgi:hypothetical protein